MKAIIAINKVGCIGLDGSLPWRSSEDLKHFKKLTLGSSCIVGRKTYEKLPKLKNRALFVASSENPISEILKFNPEWVIGGKQIYEHLLPLCDEIHVSVINDYTEGDTYFEIPEKLRCKCIYYNFDTNEL